MYIDGSKVYNTVSTQLLLIMNIHV